MPRAISILGPTFERRSSDSAVASPPATPEAWQDLLSCDAIALQELGMLAFGEVAGGTLYLFSGEWFSAIPEGFEVVTINGTREWFDPDASSDDIRFGCLAYGLVL
jgi:hypothetical protein